MRKRKTNELLRLLSKESTNGESRKRTRSSVKADADVKQQHKKQKTQWMHPSLGLMVRQLVGHPSVSYQLRYLHHATLQIPRQPNVLHEENLFTHFDVSIPWTVHLPLPLYCTPTGAGPTVPDLMVHFLHVKDNYKRELRNLHTAYKRIETRHSLSGFKLQTIEEDDSIQNSAAVIYAAQLDRDPDPHLLPEYGYDYHFTGGSMATIGSAEDCELLATMFTAVGASLEELNVIRLVRSNDRKEIQTGKVVKCCLTGTPGPILEVTADVGDRWVLVRKRHTVVALREVHSAAQSLDETCTTSVGNSEWRAVQSIFSTVPFASVCIARPVSHIKRTIIVCTTDYEKRLRLWAINRNDEVARKGDHELPHVKTSLEAQDNWSAVRCIDGRSLIGCLDRHRIHLYSIRSEAEETGKRDGSDPNPNPKEVESDLQLEYRGSSSLIQWTMPCERPCALEVSPSEGLIFIATCHKLFVATVDHWDENHSQASRDEKSPSPTMLEINVLLVFAHNLRQRPVFMSHQRQTAFARSADGRKVETEQHFLLVGSHLPMSYGLYFFEKSYLGTEPARPKYQTRHLPLHPPKFCDAYKLAQARGFCLSADEPLRRRFIACQSGMALIPTGKGEEGRELHIVLQTSGGDLLHQQISPHRTDAEDPSGSTKARAEQTIVAETLHRWHERLLQDNNGKPKTYKATDFRTLTKFRDIFNILHDDPSELKDWISRASSSRESRAKRAKQCAPELSRESSPEDFDPANQDRAGSSGDSKRSKPQPWRQTIEELQQYKDVLAPAMLAVWGFGTVAAAAAATEQIPTTLPPYQDVNERIDSWVTNADTTNPMPLVENKNLHHVQEDPFDCGEPALEHWQKRTIQEDETVQPSEPNTIVYDDAELNILSQATTLPANHRFNESKAPTVARSTKKNVVKVPKKMYVKGF